MTEPQLRLGDADRDAAAAALGEHYAQGRLTTDEHAERLEAIWAARTHGDLMPIFSDLPDARPAPGPAGARAPARPDRFGPPRALALLPPILLVLVLLTVLTHRPWVLLLVGVLVFVRVRRARSRRRRTG